MSRQNKAKQKAIIAAGITKLHQAGQRGPSRTTPAHGKVLTARILAERKRAADLEKEAAAAERAANAAKAPAKKDGKPAAKKTGYQGKNPRKPDAAAPAQKAARKVASGTIAQ